MDEVGFLARVTLKSMLGALGTMTNAIAELRGQVGTGHGGAPETEAPPAGVARLAVNAALAPRGVPVGDARGFDSQGLALRGP